MSRERLPLSVTRITHFASIDGAMVRVVKAVGIYEAARYTAGERAALDRVVKAAVGLKDTFVRVAQQINEEYEQEQLDSQRINKDKAKR